MTSVSLGNLENQPEVEGPLMMPKTTPRMAW